MRLVGAPCMEIVLVHLVHARIGRSQWGLRPRCNPLFLVHLPYPQPTRSMAPFGSSGHAVATLLHALVAWTRLMACMDLACGSLHALWYRQVRHAACGLPSYTLALCKMHQETCEQFLAGTLDRWNILRSLHGWRPHCRALCYYPERASPVHRKWRAQALHRHRSQWRSKFKLKIALCKLLVL